MLNLSLDFDLEGEDAHLVDDVELPGPVEVEDRVEGARMPVISSWNLSGFVEIIEPVEKELVVNEGVVGANCHNIRMCSSLPTRS